MLPPPPPEPTAAQADKVAVPEGAGQTELALPSSEAPPAPQNTGGGLFSGLFPGTPPLVLGAAAVAQHHAMPVPVSSGLTRGGVAAGAPEAVKETAGNAAGGVLGAAQAQAPEGLVAGARPPYSAAMHPRVPTCRHATGG